MEEASDGGGRTWRRSHMESAGEALADGLRNILTVVAPSAAAAATAAAADTAAENKAEDTAQPAPSKPAPPKVAYHPNVRCLRGGGGRGTRRDPDWPHPVIVGKMYRVGEGYVSEEKATEEEKAKGPVEPATRWRGKPVEGFDLRGWAAADIQGLRGADGKLDLEGAILCGVALERAQLQGANLCEAQLQGANLDGAQLQGAYLREAELQGAYLIGAQLHGADLYGAQLRGAVLCDARLQGAFLRDAQLQGADLSYADLSVLPKGFLLPKWGVAGETEATKEDRSTILKRANLSVLPKGSEYSYYGDAAQPTNLTEAKASGAIFTEADLCGVIFSGTSLKDATLKDAKFTPFRPPERPASDALAKAFLCSVASGAIVAADDDDDDDSDDGSDDGSDESPVDAKLEQAIDVVTDRLAAAAQTLMHTADDSVGKVQALLRSSLLKSGKAARRTSSVSSLDAEPDRILAELLCTKLESATIIATDKQAAFFETLSTHVISPLFEQHLPKVLIDARSELPKPTGDGAGAVLLLDQLLAAFTERALDAGKVTLLKRLAPIVSKAVGAGAPAEKGKRQRSAGTWLGTWLGGWRVTSGSAAAHDEEEALMPPQEVADYLVQALWQTLYASLEAQVGDAILSCAKRHLKRAGKSVRRMARRLDNLEYALVAKAGAANRVFLKRFGLVGGEKGGLRSRLLKETLTAATQYEVSVGGFSGSLGMARLAWTCSRIEMTKHENELQYLKEKLKKLEEMTISDQSWRDVSEAWQAILALSKSVDVERGRAVLQCIASDEELLKALGMAEMLYKAAGEVPTEVVWRLNDGPGAHIRTHAYKYDKLIILELVRIQRVKGTQLRVLTLAGSAFVPALIATANLLSQLYYDVLESDEVSESERLLLSLLFPVGAVAVLLLLLLCLAGCYYRRSLVRLCSRCWMRSTTRK